jgi:hypothetical protein
MIDGFVSPLRLEKIGKRTWILIDDLVFESARFNGRFCVPRGFQTNLASIPRIAFVFFPPIGHYDRAAVLHDAGYGNSLVSSKGDRIFMIKRFTDQLFYDAMLCDKVGEKTAKMMYKAVDLFGNADGHPLAQNSLETVYGKR